MNQEYFEFRFFRIVFFLVCHYFVFYTLIKKWESPDFFLGLTLYEYKCFSSSQLITDINNIQVESSLASMSSPIPLCTLVCAYKLLFCLTVNPRAYLIAWLYSEGGFGLVAHINVKANPRVRMSPEIQDKKQRGVRLHRKISTINAHWQKPSFARSLARPLPAC